jgi:hypothetical protein
MQPHSKGKSMHALFLTFSPFSDPRNRFAERLHAAMTLHLSLPLSCLLSSAVATSEGVL